MPSRDNSREEWERELIERQHNLTPAQITRTSRFRASGLPRTAPLPIAVRWIRVSAGTALFAVGIGVRVVFDTTYLSALGAALGVAGLLVALSGVRWTAR